MRVAGVIDAAAFAAAEAKTCAAIDDAIDVYDAAEEAAGKLRGQFSRELGRRDLFYLMVRLLHRQDVGHQWLYERIREVEAEPNGYLDLWAREHYKSTIITFAKTIQDILASHGDDPLPEWNGIEPTFGIFSHTRPIAKKFLRQIKQEFEHNAALKILFPDVLYDRPHRDAVKWSEETGITVRRNSNARDSTVEAWGLVDGQPTGAHFFVRIYDDVVTKASVNTPDQIAKTTESWELSINLGVAEGGIERYIGTRYAIMDTYHEMMQRGAIKRRVYPSTHDGTESGKPVFLSPKAHEKKRRAMGPTTFAAQMLQRPISKATATFDVEHLNFTEIRPKTLNVYILGDPAHSKRRGSDKTAIAAIGIDAQRNKYLLDGYNHRMNLKERWDALYTLRKKWIDAPGVQGVHVGYERYGLQADIEHFESEMERLGIQFPIEELNWPKEGAGAKGDRIGRLRPDHEQRHFFLPALVWRGDKESNKELCFLKVENGEVKYVKAERNTKLMDRMVKSGEPWRVLRPIKRVDEEGRIYDVTLRYVIEYLAHPAAGASDDLIDAASRIYDIDFKPPVIINPGDTEPEQFDD